MPRIGGHVQLAGCDESGCGQFPSGFGGNDMMNEAVRRCRCKHPCNVIGWKYRGVQMSCRQEEKEMYVKY